MRGRKHFGSWSTRSVFPHIVLSPIETDCLSPAELVAAKGLIKRRVGREPLQYILGTQEFCGLEFDVNQAVLIPRPETELLVDYVAQRIPAERQATIIDVCTGSGCIAVAIARLRPRARVIATDLSTPSLDVARQECHPPWGM